LFHCWNQWGRDALKSGTGPRYRVLASRNGFGGIEMLVGALVTFLVVILILYLINMLPLDGRAKQICRVVVIVLGVISLLKYIAVF
jgi:Na+/melibiose symporter-like transporter